METKLFRAHPTSAQPQRRQFTRWCLCFLSAVLLAPSPARAQQSPDAQQIIEALLPPASRKTRNIAVRRKAPVPAPQKVVQAPAQPGIDLTIRFDFNSSNLRKESRPLLSNLAMALKSPDLRQNRFLIEGHTDAAGPAKHNLKLSLDRANQVRRFLIASGVEPRRVTTAGRGENQPANPADPLSGENRRVRIVNLE